MPDRIDAFTDGATIRGPRAARGRPADEGGRARIPGMTPVKKVRCLMFFNFFAAAHGARTAESGSAD